MAFGQVAYSLVKHGVVYQMFTKLLSLHILPSVFRSLGCEFQNAEVCYAVISIETQHGTARVQDVREFSSMPIAFYQLLNATAYLGLNQITLWRDYWECLNK